MTLGIAALVPHWTMESHVVVHLDDRSAWRDIRSDRPATNADIRGCLAALDALLLRGSFYAGAERTFLKNVTLAAPHSGTSAAHSSAVNTNAPIQPSGDSSSRDNIVLQVAAMFLSSRVLILTPVCSSCWSRSPLLSFGCSCSKQQKQCPRLRYTCFAAASVAYSIFAFVSSRLPVPSALPSHSTRRPHLSRHNVHVALRYKWTGATGDITSADLDAFLAQHEAGNLKVRPPRPLPSIPSSIVAVKRAHRSTSRASQTLPSTWPRP